MQAFIFSYTCHINIEPLFFLAKIYLSHLTIKLHFGMLFKVFYCINNLLTSSNLT